MGEDTKQGKHNKEKEIKKAQNVVLVLTLLFVCSALVIGGFLIKFYLGGFKSQAVSTTYDKYYVMITDNYKSEFWQSIYKGAFEEAKEEGIYVELLGQNISGDYTCEELMKIAIASEVDGIIVFANESDEMTELINEAANEGIPVVTLYNDNTHSERLSFVGVGSYNIGREYGKQIFSIISEKQNEESKEEGEAEEEAIEVAVLVNTDTQDTSQNIIISALQETLNKEGAPDSNLTIKLVPINNANAFSVEESIRDIFMQEDVPDVIVCLNELNTVCAYQAVVDFNMVGDVNILGYYDSDTIVNAIDRGVVYATISIDTAQLGQYCIEALSDYYEFGNTSQYYTADITLINKNNVKDYLKEEEGDE